MTWLSQRSFKHGEVSPHVDGLANPELHQQSCRKVEGATVSPSGTISKRSGTQWVGSTGFSTATAGSFSTYTSGGDVRVIPYHWRDTSAALVFEVLTNGDGDSWGVIRAVLNGTWINSEDVATPSSTAWHGSTSSNLPFANQTAPTPDRAVDYLPPGSTETTSTDNSFGGVFGMHMYTADELKDVSYFQHEEYLFLLHKNHPPMQVWSEKQSTASGVPAAFTASTKLKFGLPPIETYSPEVVRVSERFSMVCTNVSAGNPETNNNQDFEFTLETTRDWFDTEDIGGLYRIGGSMKRYSNLMHDVKNKYVIDRGGYFVRIIAVDGPRKARCYSATTTFATGGGEPTINGLTDPYDWDGPWLPTDEPIQWTQIPTNPGTIRLDINISNLSNLSTGSDITQENHLVGSIIGYETTSQGLLLIKRQAVVGNSDTIANGAWIGYRLVGNWEIDSTVPGPLLYRYAKKGERHGEVAFKDVVSITQTSSLEVVDSYNRSLKIKAGDIVGLYITPNKDAIPQDHASPAFDTVTRGDRPEPQTLTPTNNAAGVVFVNGGAFAIQGGISQGIGLDSEQVEFGHVYQGHCIRPPTHEGVTSKFSLGWSHSVGFPTTGCSYKGRVFFAGFAGAPGTVVASSTEGPFDFGLGADTQDALHFIISDIKGGGIKWMYPGEDLILGTDNAEYAVKGTPLSPASIGVNVQSHYGSSDIQPVMAGNYLIYVQKDKNTLRAMRWRYEQERYMSTNITDEHRHLFDGKQIKELALYQGGDDPLLFILLTDGSVINCRISEEGQFFGFSQPKFPHVLSLCGKQASVTTGDEVILMTNKYAGGSDKYHILRYDEDPTPPLLDAWVKPTTLSGGILSGGLDPFFGTNVGLYADGVYLGEFSVVLSQVGSSINLGTVEVPGGINWMDGGDGAGLVSAGKVYIGGKIETSVTTQVLEFEPRRGLTAGRNRNYSSIIALLNNSRGVKVNGYDIATYAHGTLPNLVTGWTEIPVAGLYGAQPTLSITTDRPYPMELAAISADVTVGDSGGTNV